MAKTKDTIKIEVPSAAERERLGQPITRAYDFPDGIRRLITLPQRYWETLEQAERELGSDLIHDLMDAALKGAAHFAERDKTAFELEVQIGMKCLIRGFWKDHIGIGHNIANQDCGT